VAAGTDERADRFLTPQIEAMEEHADVFVSGNTVAQGNLHYVIATGASHSYEYGYDYLYDALPLYFPAQ